tara:strand:+ start:806 stop:976 length:171 start_codon:yes stop_codon:yes gene_type:complete
MKFVNSISVTYVQNGRSTKSNELGVRSMTERMHEKLLEFRNNMTVGDKYSRKAVGK